MGYLQSVNVNTLMLRGIWLALVFVLTVMVLVEPVHATVTSLSGDQDDNTYSTSESITLSGNNRGADRLIQLIIVHPDGERINCAGIVTYCGSTTVSRNTFTFTPIPINSAFNETGQYKFHVYDQSQGEDDAFTVLINYDGSVATFIGTILEIDDISRKTTYVGEQLTFTANVTDSLHTDVMYSLKSPYPSSAQISTDGEFVWSPIDGDIRSRHHIITIVALTDTQTAEKEVQIKVNERRPLVQTGVISLIADKMTYNRAESVTLSGTTSGVDTGTTVRFSIDHIEHDYTTESGSITTQSGGVFTLPEFTVNSAFPEDGKYIIKAFTSEQTSNKYTTYANYSRITLTYLGSQLELRVLPQQYATVGTRISFTILPTDSSISDITYELTGNPPNAARIGNSGVFSWTPTASDLGSSNTPRDHIITISAQSGSDTAVTQDVTITVNPPQTTTDPEPNNPPNTQSGGSDTTEPARITSIISDKSSYTSDERIVFSGTAVNAVSREILSVVIAPPEGGNVVANPKIINGLTSNNKFTLAPSKITDLFRYAGTYTITAFTNSQGKSDGATMNMKYDNSRLTIEFDTLLEIANIPRQSVDAGSTLNFTAAATDSSFTDLTWSISNSTLDDATIDSRGKFTWTPSESLNAPVSYTVTINVTDDTQSATRSVSIDVTKPAPTQTTPTPPQTVTPTEPPRTDPLDEIRKQFLTTAQGVEPQSLVDRYENDAGYKAWFDKNFEGLDIRGALGMATVVPLEPDPRFTAYMDQGDDPQTYVDRYNSDSTYKAWFDASFAGLTIEKAAGLGSKTIPAPSDTTAPPPPPATVAPPSAIVAPPPEPDPSFVQYMTQGDDPQTYVDRYNSDPTYKAWFDANFTDLTIEKATGLGSGDVVAPPPEPDPSFVQYMTQGDDPQTYVDRYNSDPTYKAWFDANFEGMTIQQATGYVAPTEIPCLPGTTLKDGKCVKVTTNPISNVGGCLVATATYGTELAPQVQSLREIRDSTLLSTSSGTAFMTAFNDVYYSFSPTIADWERQSPEFRTIIQTLITPMISSLSIMSLAEPGSESDVLALGIAVIGLNIGLYIAAPATAVMILRARLHK